MYLLPALALWALGVQALGVKECPLLGPVFPAPANISKDSLFLEATKNLTSEIKNAIKTGGLSSDSLSVQIFSGKDSQSAFSFSHTDSAIKDGSVGVREVDEDTVFRIGSNSKLWTMLLYMTLNGTKYFEEPVSKYVPELRTPHNRTTEADQIDFVRWDEITIGQLASHQAGIARDYAFGDLAFLPSVELQASGFPALPKSQQLTCGNNYPCDRKAFLKGLLETRPLAPTSSTPLYSNAGYQILGYALEAIAKRPYEKVLQERLIDPLKLTRSSYHAPHPSLAVIPGNVTYSWFNTSIGDETPAGGLYSSAKDMATVGRAILSSAIVDPAVTRRWMKPATHSSSLHFSVGHPWEIFTFNEPRLTDLYTKSGDVGKYSSAIALSPDYEVGFVVVAAGENTPSTTALIAEKIADIFLPTLEKIAKKQASERFAGTFALTTASHNSSITIVADNGPGLKVSKWISNSVNMFEALGKKFGLPDPSKLSIRLQPANLQSPGRIAFSAVIQVPSATPTGGPILGLCHSWLILDSFVYGNTGLPEFVFDLDAKGEAKSLTPRALRITLDKVRKTI